MSGRRGFLGNLLGGAAAVVAAPFVIAESRVEATEIPPAPLKPKYTATEDGPSPYLPPYHRFASHFTRLRVQISEKKAVQFQDNWFITRDYEAIGALRLLLAQGSDDFREVSEDAGRFGNARTNGDSLDPVASFRAFEDRRSAWISGEGNRKLQERGEGGDKG